MNSRPTLTIVCGLPGAGKTTLATELERGHDAVRLCADEWMHTLGIDLWDAQARAKIEALQWTVARQLLARGIPVIVEWGTWSRSERDALRTGAREIGAAVELHYVSAPVDVLFDRVRRRAMENPPITRDQLASWFAAFEVPSADELALYD
jgi:predicted kinase